MTKRGVELAISTVLGLGKMGIKYEDDNVMNTKVYYHIC